MTRTERGVNGCANASSSATDGSGAAGISTRYGCRSTSLISCGLSIRARMAALLPDSHSPQWHVAMELGRRTAMTPGMSYAWPHFGQRISGMCAMIHFGPVLMLVADSQTKSQSRFGLREKFILIFAVQTLVIAGVILLIERYAVRKAMTDQTVQQGSAIADTIESTAGYYDLFGLTDDLKAILGDLLKNKSVEYADFVSSEGKTMAASKPTPPPFLIKRALVPESKVDLGSGLHLFVVPFTENRGDPASKAKGYFRIVVNETQAQEAIASLKWWNVAVTILAFLIAVALAWFSAQLIVRPIIGLVATASRIAQGDLTQRTTIEREDEIGHLSDAFNSMAANLEKTVKSLVQSQMKLKSVVEMVGSRSRTVIDRVDEQRSVIDATYHSIDQLNSGVRKITDNVEALSASSEETSSSMLEMVASME